jgi:hypothetical protein
MKLPITFEQFKSDPSKAIVFCSIWAMTERVYYYRAEWQSKAINERMREAAANVRGKA